MPTETMTPPVLHHWEGGWAAIRIETGELIGEYHRDSKLVHRLNPATVRLVPIGQYLASLNDL